eukprot:8717298-Lingulodinium_polyedra.AAC.1
MSNVSPVFRSPAATQPLLALAWILSLLRDTQTKPATKIMTWGTNTASPLKQSTALAAASWFASRN